MKEIVISNCEKNYVLKCLDIHTRVDGRAFNEFRPLLIEFGPDWGCCIVRLGQTCVLAQVSCEIQIPKTSRPQEGILNINVELSPMGAPNFEAGRQSEASVHLNRMLEKCIKDSRAVDLESLCIRANEKVWALRVDINVLNHEGNILDCASVAALTALAHFKRPDVTSDGENIIVHSHKERDPIPTVIHHYPVCISYVLFNRNCLVADPTFLEENVAEAQLIYSINAFKEICSLYLGGSALADPSIIIECANKAAKRAFTVVQEIKTALENDTAKRENSDSTNLSKNFLFHFIDIRDSKAELTELLNRWSIKDKSRKKKSQTSIVETMEVVETNKGTEMEEEKIEDVEEISDDSDDSDIYLVENPPKQIETYNLDDDDAEEEEKVVTLYPEKMK